MKPQNLEQQLEGIHEASFGWALACCGWNRSEAEEALQAAYLKAIEGKARFNGNASLKTWFFGVVKRTALEQRRGHLVRDVALGRWLRRTPAAEPPPNPERLSSNEESLRLLRTLLSRLSPRQRDLLLLTFYHEMTVEEAADVMQLRVGTARTHYERAKTRLRELMSKAGGR